jgi:hypothetical protein
MLLYYRCVYLAKRFFNLLLPQTYLAGAMSSLKDSGASWRDRLTPELTDIGIKVQNPVKDEVKKINPPEGMNYKEYLFKLKVQGKRNILKQVVARIKIADLRCVAESDFIICNWENSVPTVGTIEELVRASDWNIPVYILTNDNISDINEWLLSFPLNRGGIFKHKSELIGYLKGRYKKE